MLIHLEGSQDSVGRVDCSFFNQQEVPAVIFLTKGVSVTKADKGRQGDSRETEPTVLEPFPRRVPTLWTFQ